MMIPHRAASSLRPGGPNKSAQLVLFELKQDTRPAAERTAAGRYREPTLFSTLSEPPSGKGAAGG
jgi:hypothetical protein